MCTYIYIYIYIYIFPPVNLSLSLSHSSHEAKEIRVVKDGKSTPSDSPASRRGGGTGFL